MRRDFSAAPLRSNSRAAALLASASGSKQETRISVSTREATVFVKFLARPAAIFSSNLRALCLCLRQLPRLQFIPTGHVGIKKRQLLLGRELVSAPRPSPDQFDANAFARRNPLQFVSRSDPVLVRNCLRHGQLKLGSHFRHILTTSRIESLLHSVPDVKKYSGETADPDCPSSAARRL